MHENREISSAPSPLGEGRSAKASCRTADMHVLERSDCAVVPVNQPNKAAIAAAEAGEGRAQMKENIGQPRMLPTQSGNRMSQGLDGVRTAARERKQERFTSLLHHLTIALLRDSLPPDTIDSWRSAPLESVEASQPGSPRNVPGAAFK